MTKNLTLSLFLFLLFFSCKNSENEKQLLNKEIDLIKEEKKIDPETKKLEEEELNLINTELQNNILHCENKDFIIKIDRLKNDDIRYTSWNKPKTILDKPNLVLYKGRIEKQGTEGGYHYFFNSGNWEYIIENNLIGESLESTGIFLKLMKGGKQKRYTKMTELTTKKNYDLKSYTKNALIGNWWTPHFAVRKISFHNDNTFLFNEGDGEKLKGNYTLSNKTVQLVFNNGSNNTLTIGGGINNTSLTLIGDGENFVKEQK